MRLFDYLWQPLRRKFFSSRGRRGIALVEVMIAFALLTVVAVGAASVLKNIYQGLSEAERKEDLGTLIGDLQTAIADPADCLQNFRNPANGNLILDKTAAASSLGQPILIRIKDTAGTLVKDSTTPPYVNKIKVDQLRLKDLKPVAASTTLYTARVVISASPNPSAGAIKGYRERTVNQMFLEVNAANALTQCYSTTTEVQMEKVCDGLGGAWNAAAKSCAMDPVKTCTDLGGTYNDTNKKCELGQDLTALCTDLGGEYDGTSKKCQLGQDVTTLCKALGGSYSAGTGCTMKTAGGSSGPSVPEADCTNPNGKPGDTRSTSSNYVGCEGVRPYTTKSFLCTAGRWVLLSTQNLGGCPNNGR